MCASGNFPGDRVKDPNGHARARAATAALAAEWKRSMAASPDRCFVLLDDGGNILLGSSADTSKRTALESKPCFSRRCGNSLVLGQGGTEARSAYLMLRARPPSKRRSSSPWNGFANFGQLVSSRKRAVVGLKLSPVRNTKRSFISGCLSQAA